MKLKNVILKHFITQKEKKYRNCKKISKIYKKQKLYILQCHNN